MYLRPRSGCPARSRSRVRMGDGPQSQATHCHCRAWVRRSVQVLNLAGWGPGRLLGTLDGEEAGRSPIVVNQERPSSGTRRRCAACRVSQGHRAAVMGAYQPNHTVATAHPSAVWAIRSTANRARLTAAAAARSQRSLSVTPPSAAPRTSADTASTPTPFTTRNTNCDGDSPPGHDHVTRRAADALGSRARGRRRTPAAYR